MLNADQRDEVANTNMLDDMLLDILRVQCDRHNHNDDDQRMYRYSTIHQRGHCGDLGSIPCSGPPKHVSKTIAGVGIGRGNCNSNCKADMHARRCSLVQSDKLVRLWIKPYVSGNAGDRRLGGQLRIHHLDGTHNQADDYNCRSHKYTKPEWRSRMRCDRCSSRHIGIL